jgi:glycosyltransferase involved in cell wall biosynthesis
MSDRRITIVIPAYNAAGFIADALDSILRQIRPPDEVVIVNDGSTDETSSRVRAWLQSHPLPAKLIDQENRGAPGARNRAVREAGGDLIALLDADDLLLPRHLETLEAAFDQSPDLVLAFGDVKVHKRQGPGRRFLEGKRLSQVAYEERGGVQLLGEGLFESLVISSYIPTASTLFKRDKAVEIGLFDEEIPYCDDRDFVLRLSRAGRFAHCPQILAEKREHGTNLTHPKNLLPLRLSRLKASLKMVEQADALGLSAGERRAARRALDHTAKGLLYAAARHGWKTYREAAGSLPAGHRKQMWHPRRLLRVAAAEIGLIGKR